MIRNLFTRIAAKIVGTHPDPEGDRKAELESRGFGFWDDGRGTVPLTAGDETPIYFETLVDHPSEVA